MGRGVRIFGDTFRVFLALGLTWLDGAPGAVLVYCVAGVLLALADRCWANRRLGLRLLGGTGLFWVGVALLQA